MFTRVRKRQKRRYVRTESPEDVQRAIQLLLWLFESEARPRPVYGRALIRACRVLKVEYHVAGKHWVLCGRWRERLRLAGLDPDDPFKVLDQGRLDLTWQQLIDTETFHEEVQARAIALGLKAPKAEEIVHAVAKKERRPRGVASGVAQPFSTLLPASLKKRLTGKNK